MSLVFISHAKEDKYFVNLLVELLKYHDIDVWYDTLNLHASDQFRIKIEAAIKKAQTLIVIVSKNSVNSKWVFEEIIQFRTRKSNPQILPLLLDETNLDEVADVLAKYQAISFTQCMVTGFKELLEVFAKEFLPKSDTNEKRLHDQPPQERRKYEERRSTDVRKRLSFGFKLSFQRATLLGKFDMKNMLVDALFYEASKYEFLDSQNHTKNPKEIIENVVQKILKQEHAEESFANMDIIDTICLEIFKDYKVKSRNRRGTQ